MSDLPVAKILAARDYVPSSEVVLPTPMGDEQLFIPVDRNAAISQTHLTVAIAQKAWDSVAVRMVNKREVTPKEIKDMVDAAKVIVEMRALAYSNDRPANLPPIGSTATAIGQGIGQALTEAIRDGGAKPNDLMEKLARAGRAEAAKPVVDIPSDK
jgi:hypothetical protein